jgi:hydrogenase-4 membrane subunit HyfE
MLQLLQAFAQNLQQILLPLEVGLLFTTLLITLEDSIATVIRLYRSQTGLLLIVVFLTTFIRSIESAGGASGLGTAQPDPGRTVLLLGLIAVTPCFLFLFIDRMLKHATTSIVKGGPLGRLTPEEEALVLRIWSGSEPEQRDADLYSEHRLASSDAEGVGSPPLSRPRSRAGLDLLFFGFLVILSFLVAFRIFPTSSTNQQDAIGLAVPLTLHLAGLYNTVIRRDVLTLIIGLLIMDHGLYLAVVKIVAVPIPATFFVIALLLYTLITVVILTVMIPRFIRAFSEAEQARRKKEAERSDDLIATSNWLARSQEIIDLDRIAMMSPLSEAEPSSADLSNGVLQR